MVPTLEIVPVHPDQEDLFARWYAALAAADRAGREDTAVTWQLGEVRVALSKTSREERQLGFAGLVDGEVVATGYLAFPLLDNRWRADVEVHVVPHARRRGHGSAMLAHLEDLARAEGRSTLLAEVPWPFDGGPDGNGPGVAFARAHGFRLGLADVQRQLALPVPHDVLAGLEAEAMAHAEGYTLRGWIGPVPEDLVVEWAALNASLDTEAPTGELDLEPATPDPSVVRETEEARARQGRVSVHTVAVRDDGRLAAYSEIIVPSLEPGRCYQWGTLVRREDRGHRLGLAVKVANLRLLQAERPDVRTVVTYNAASNAHMVAVNDALGFVPTERLGEFQKRWAEQPGE